MEYVGYMYKSVLVLGRLFSGASQVVDSNSYMTTEILNILLTYQLKVVVQLNIHMLSSTAIYPMPPDPNVHKNGTVTNTTINEQLTQYKCKSVLCLQEFNNLSNH